MMTTQSSPTLGALSGPALFRCLWQHGRLALKRHPMYDSSRYARGWVMILALMGLGYLFFFGSLMGFTMQDGLSREAYTTLDRGLVFFTLFDFLLRIPFTSAPSQQIKPYLLLPIRRGRLVDFLIVRAGLDGFNLLWMAFFVPFAILTVTRFYGLWGVVRYLVGLWLWFVAGGYLYQICRSLTRRHAAWWLLPVVLFAGIIAAMLPDEHIPQEVTMELGEGWIQGQVWSFAAVVALGGILGAVARILVGDEV